MQPRRSALKQPPARCPRPAAQEHYPWFLPTYLAYPYAIQRVDVIRYFLLYHYGGVYIDLDMGCNKRLDFMLQYNFTAPLTHPGGISNDVLAAAPRAPYLHRCLGQLRQWNRWMVIKYVQARALPGGGAEARVRRAGGGGRGRGRLQGVQRRLLLRQGRGAGYAAHLRHVGQLPKHGSVRQGGAARPRQPRAHSMPRRSPRPRLLPPPLQVMFSTGPMFLTTQYSLFGGKGDVAVVPAPMYGKYDKSGDPYFYHLHGSSWHNSDAAFIFWLDRHKGLLIVIGIVVAVTTVCGYWLRCIVRMRKSRTS